MRKYYNVYIWTTKKGIPELIAAHLFFSEKESISCILQYPKYHAQIETNGQIIYER